MPRDQIFVSYSHRDKRWFDELLTTLAPLIRQRRVAVWEDTKIRVGKKWKAEIADALSSAKIAVLLVSRNFLASEYIAENELPPLLEAAEKDGLTIVWVAIGHSLYEETAITEFQAANEPSHPLNSLNEAELDRELVRIAKTIDALASGSDDSSKSAAPQPNGPKEETEDTSPIGRMRKVLAEGKWAWRSVDVLAAKAGISNGDALDSLRSDAEIDLGKGKSGKVIARLRSRRS
jgi:hypothetical protein